MPDFSLTENIFCADIYQYNVRTDLTDLIPGNDVFLIRSEKSAETEGAGNDDGADPSAAFVENEIADPSKFFAVAPVDHIFLF